MIGPVTTPVPQLSAPFGALGQGPDESHRPTVADAARGFESIFLNLLLKEMRQTLGPGGLFSGDGSDIYGGMFDQFMSQHLAQGKGMGLAQALIRQLGPAAKHEPPRASHDVRASGENPRSV